MRRLGTSEKDFQDAVPLIFAAPEVLVVVRYVYGGGKRDFLILRAMSEFHQLLGTLWARDSVVVMNSFRKIREGKVDRGFIESAAAACTKGSSWVLIGKDNFEHTPASAYAESEAEVREELQDRLGNHVCIVDEPDYISDEHSINGYIPDSDGVVRPGSY
jgi:hypothetical protein